MCWVEFRTCNISGIINDLANCCLGILPEGNKNTLATGKYIYWLILSYFLCCVKGWICKFTETCQHMLVIVSLVYGLPTAELFMFVFTVDDDCCLIHFFREYKPKCGGICVANHTSPMDIAMLACNNCFTLVSLRLFCVTKIEQFFSGWSKA